MTTTVDTRRLQAWRAAFHQEEETCPWPGPRPLRESDTARLLAGRARDRKLFSHEVQNHRLILLGGESGVGKSSLLDAALVPDLRGIGYEVVSCRDWGADIDAGADMLAKAIYVKLTDEQREDVADPGREGAPKSAGMRFFLDLNEQFGDGMVIILDQFEELLRYNRNRKEQILARLVEIHHKCTLRIVLSFRSEYLHELKNVESTASPFAISRYMLDPVAERHAKDVIRNTREPGTPVIQPTAAQEVADAWERARKEGTRTGASLTQIGMLHLQAMLYALHARAGKGRVIDESTLAAIRAEAAKTVGPTDADLFSYGLQEAVSTKLLRCEQAAVKQGMDRFLVRGAATVLSKTVDHLSSGGYKLVREAYDLAKMALADKIAVCLPPLEQGDPDDSHVDASMRRILSTIAHAALGDDSGREEMLTASRATLAAEADKSWTDGELSWTGLIAADAGATASNNPAAGPLRAMSPAHVLIEEFRRYAWALVWLKESNLIRITRHGEQSMVSLIHDGFGEALVEWSKDYEDRDRAWGMYALTAPLGASHLWHDDGRTWEEPDGSLGSMRDELCGRPGQPIRFGNLVFKGNAIIRARFENTVFISCDFRGVMFQRCTFAGVTFLNCQLDGALFSDCTIVGKPDPAPDRPGSDDIERFIPDNPSFNVPDAQKLADAFRHYREDGRTGAAHLIAQPAGRPAQANDATVPENEGWLPWTPAAGGFVAYGGRVSALTFRGTKFGEFDERGALVPGTAGQISFRGVSGSGLDLAELDGASFEFHRCVLRHVAFSSPRPTPGTPRQLRSLDVSVNYTVAIQWWIDQGFTGKFRASEARLVHLWNDSAGMGLTDDPKTRALQITGVGMRGYPTEAYPDSGEVIFSTIAAQTNYRRGVHLAQDAR